MIFHRIIDEHKLYMWADTNKIKLITSMLELVAYATLIHADIKGSSVNQLPS